MGSVQKAGWDLILIWGWLGVSNARNAKQA